MKTSRIDEMVEEFDLKFYYEHEERGLTYLRNDVVGWLRQALTEALEEVQEEAHKAGYIKGGLDEQMTLNPQKIREEERQKIYEKIMLLETPEEWKPWLTTTLTQRDKELVEVIQARWNNLFGDAQNSPEEVIHQMNIFIQNL